MTERIWSIGHSVHTPERFIELLQLHAIELVADVRILPASRRAPWTTVPAFAERLASEGIAHVHLRDLGGHREPQPDSPHTGIREGAFRGYADHMDTPVFGEALNALKELAMAHRTAMLCAEGKWRECHRSFIADRLYAEDWSVVHILPDGTVEDHVLRPEARIVEGRLSYPGSGLFP
jgi:uncharacterized protein (DUF488 family)